MSCEQSGLLCDIFKSQLKQLPVTCIKFYNDYLIGAIGGDLHLYKLSNLKNHYLLNVFLNETIHGIVINNFNIVAFGGKKIATIETNGNLISAAKIIPWTAEDCILDCIWTSDSRFVCLTAHNVLLSYNFNKPAVVVSKVSCEERSILYSGKIINSKWDELIILSGTVYQELIIWSSGKCVSHKYPVIHRLKGHKGVIFSITYNENTKQICSTSDDRTVRVWQVYFPSLESCVENWQKAHIVLSFSAFKHTARVWRSLFLPDNNLVSIGEDSQICLWNKYGNIIGRWEHNGDIWCLDHNDSQMAIGGNGIVIRPASSFPELSTTKLRECYGIMKSAVMSYCGNRIIVTDKGNLILFEKGEILNVFQDERFYSYCTYYLSPCRKYLILGGIKGELVLFEVLKEKFEKKCEIYLNDRIHALAWADLNIFVSCCSFGRMKVWELAEISCDIMDLKEVKRFSLPKSKERWINCAFCINEYLICGDRMGSLHLYSFSAETEEPLHTLRKIHDIKGVTDIKCFNNIIHSTGRDGTLRELIIVKDELVLLSTLKLPMDWIKSIVDTKIYGLVIMGFHGPNFLIWSVVERVTLLQLDCGGGHRSFDCILDESSGKITLNYLRMKELKFLSCPLSNVCHKTVLAGYHTKSINCSCFLSSKMGSAYVLTGSEDNALKLLCLLPTNSWTCSSTYLRHISSVRAVATVDEIVVTAGGRAQIILWLFQSISGELKLKEVDSHMLRKESDHHRSWKNSEPLVDPETRYMDLKILKTNEGQYSIFSACSDGILRIFSYDKLDSKLCFLKSVESNQGCLLKLSAVKWENDPVVITGGTDGTVSFWYEPFEKPPIHSHPLHSSGINSMDVTFDKKHLILCTGGDDTTIVLSAFTLNSKGKESLVFTLRELIHSCQITGLKITSNLIVTVGLDRKICLINWTFDGNYFKTSVISIFNSSVYDIHGLLTWPSDEKYHMKILVYGEGFELLNFDGSKILKTK